ncbi:hypothetical protein HR060_00285 [Catenovulum sp. SM1970]|uniref:hypothetical protein n=1 Tax=Marinifaba aquimaris TaxID=2741323 RepID=UPI001571FF07|nr:hypothetical protein [Marinifaba aquimaris]NTS75286.1 hypothetical protein [Marinifaba aquimaris]
MELLCSQQISPKNAFHNAFTDFIEFQGTFYVCYRQATNHVSKDGKIIILSSSDLNKWSKHSTLAQYNADLRDPKLSITPDNQLCCLFYRKVFNQQGVNIENKSCVSFSQDAKTWSAFKLVSPNNWWLWRLRWIPNQKEALGIAYRRSENRVALYQGNPQRYLDCTVNDLMSLATHGKGYPNESDIIFNQKGEAICLLRRDAGTGSAQLGIAKAPYKKWQWIDLVYYLGGPCLIQLKDGRILTCSRVFTKAKGPQTYLLEIQINENNLGQYQAKLLPLFALPSAGDNSYPAMIEKQGHLYISYYSEHESYPSDIYMAKVVLET